MKWIGQHIYDQISRFRNDVYLEDVSSGTIASGGNLGLDSNNKIVKQADTGITDLHGAGVDGSANQLLTDDGDGSVTSEANFTFDGSTLGLTGSTTANIIDINAQSLTTGKALFIDCNSLESAGSALKIDVDENSTTGIQNSLMHLAYARTGDITGANSNVTRGLDIYMVDTATNNSNISTSQLTGVRIVQEHANNNALITKQVGIELSLTGADTGTLVGGPTIGVQSQVEDGGFDIVMKSSADGGDYCSIATTTHGATTITTTDDDAAAAHFEIAADGDITLDSAAQIKLEPATGSDILLDGTISIDAGVITGATSITSTDFVGDLTGQADTVATIAGLAPNTATTQATQPNITTLAGLTSFGAAGATTDIAAGDITMYNAVDDGAPTISIGSSATERLEIKGLYATGTQQVNQAVFTTHTASTTSNRGRFVFKVDETTALQIWDAGLNLSQDKALQINGTSIISDSSGTATLSNIDALDNATEATIEAALDTLPNVTSLGTLTGLTTSGAIELGHASDTTIARLAAGVVTIEGDQIITSKPTTVGSGQSGQLGMQIARRTITQAEMNDLHNTPIAIVPALGANLVAIPVNGTIFVDRAVNQTNSAQLVIGYGSSTFANSIFFFKRFHMNIHTDFHYGLDMYLGNWGASMTAGVNTAINASADVAYTNNAFTSVDVYINYYVIDRS